MTPFDRKVVECERIIGYSFANPVLCYEALQMSGHSPIIRDGKFIMIHKNDRLAVYGDLALSLQLGAQWLSRGLSKGEWSTIRNDVAGNKNLCNRGFQLGLDACVNLNPGTPRVSNDSMSTTLEAILGAVHKDGGDGALLVVMARLGLTHELLIQCLITANLGRYLHIASAKFGATPFAEQLEQDLP